MKSFQLLFVVALLGRPAFAAAQGESDMGSLLSGGQEGAASFVSGYTDELKAALQAAKKEAASVLTGSDFPAGADSSASEPAFMPAASADPAFAQQMDGIESAIDDKLANMASKSAQVLQNLGGALGGGAGGLPSTDVTAGLDMGTGSIPMPTGADALQDVQDSMRSMSAQLSDWTSGMSDSSQGFAP